MTDVWFSPTQEWGAQTNALYEYSMYSPGYGCVSQETHPVLKQNTVCKLLCKFSLKYLLYS